MNVSSNDKRILRELGTKVADLAALQVAPGLYKLVDLPELQGLLASRPLLIDIGANDSCFKVDSAMVCFQKAGKNLYSNLRFDLFPGEHGWGGNKAVKFFKHYLG